MTVHPPLSSLVLFGLQVHLTGGVHTHNQILWGTSDPKQQAARIASSEPALKARFSSELGSVSPNIVVPSKESSATTEWTTEKIDLYAKQAVIGLADNNSCNCLALKCLIVPSGEGFQELGEKYGGRGGRCWSRLLCFLVRA